MCLLPVFTYWHASNCHIPEWKGEEWFCPLGHFSLLASIQARTTEGNIKRRETKANDPGIVLYSHITLSFCVFICQNTEQSVLFGSDHKYVLCCKCMWVVGWREGRLGCHLQIAYFSQQPWSTQVHGGEWTQCRLIFQIVKEARSLSIWHLLGCWFFFLYHFQC